MTEITIEYFEDLDISGQTCPPEDCFFSDGITEYYRAVLTDPATSDCFTSHRLKNPDRIYNLDECEVRSVSLSMTIEGLIHGVFKTPAFKKREKLVGVVILCEADGPVKQTFAAHHHSWWRSKSFKPENVKVIKI
jgi:hypothetical protein